MRFDCSLNRSRRLAAPLTLATAAVVSWFAPTASAQPTPGEPGPEGTLTAGLATPRQGNVWSDELIADYLKKYGSTSTFAAVVVDFDRLRAEAFADAFGKIADLSPDENAKILTGLKAAEGMLRQLGAHQALILADVHPEKHFALTAVARVDNGDAATELLAGQGWQFSKQIVGDTLLLRTAGDEAPKGLQDVAAAKAALASSGEAPLRGAIFLSPDLRRVLREFAFVLKDEQLVASARSTAETLQWASFSLSPDDAMALEVRLHFPTVDAATNAAQQAKALLARGRAEVPKLEKLPFPESTLDAAVTWLTPEVVTSDLALSRSLDDETTTTFVRDLVTPAIVAMREQADRSTTTNKLKQLGLAMHNFHDTYTYFPLAGVQKKDGQGSGLSWRVHLLPFVEQAPLYNQFKLDEPWDSPHNKALIPQMPDVFRLGGGLPAGKTNAVVPIGDHFIFSGEEPTKLYSVTDGTSNTILVVQAAPSEAVIWTKPEDPTIDPTKAAEQLGDPNATVFNTLFGDGSVRAISKSIDPQTLKALFTRDGGEVVGEF